MSSVLLEGPVSAVIVVSALVASIVGVVVYEDARLVGRSLRRSRNIVVVSSIVAIAISSLRFLFV